MPIIDMLGRKNIILEILTSSSSFFEIVIVSALNIFIKSIYNPFFNFEMLLCSLFVFQEHLESKLYYMLEKKMLEKYSEYNAMDVNSLEDIFVLLDTTLTTEYKFSKKTNVHIYDVQQEKSSILQD